MTCWRSAPHGKGMITGTSTPASTYGLHGRAHMGGVAEDIDGVDHAIGDGGHGALAVAGGVALADGGDLVGESGANEIVGIGVDDDVGEEVLAGQGPVRLGIGHADVDIGVDRRIATGSDLLDRPRHMRRRAGS